MVTETMEFSLEQKTKATNFVGGSTSRRSPKHPAPEQGKNETSSKELRNTSRASLNDRSWLGLSTPESSLNDEMDRRILYILMKLVGLEILIYVKGPQEVPLGMIAYEGTFYAGTIADGGINVILRNARQRAKLREPELRLGETQIIHHLMIHGKDILRISAENVDMSFGSVSSVSSTSLQRISQFRTDAEISSTIEFGRPRKLQKWNFEGINESEFNELGTSIDHSVEWDQFAANEARFGIKASFKEEMYTVPLNRDSKEYKSRLIAAEKIAREIEKSDTKDHHLAEERGQLKFEALDDEEQRYSSVIRGTGSEKMAKDPKIEVEANKSTTVLTPSDRTTLSKPTKSSSSHLNPYAAEFKPPSDVIFGSGSLESSSIVCKFLTKDRRGRSLSKGSLQFYASKFASRSSVDCKSVLSAWPSSIRSYKIPTATLPIAMGFGHPAFQDQAAYVQSMLYSEQAIRSNYNFNMYSPGVVGSNTGVPSFTAAPTGNVPHRRQNRDSVLDASQNPAYHQYDMNRIPPFMHMSGNPMMPLQMQPPSLVTLIPSSEMTLLRDSNTGFVPVFGQNLIPSNQNLVYPPTGQPFHGNPGS